MQRSSLFFKVSFVVGLLSCFVLNGQITAPVADQIPPVAGAGHDYIHLLNETINPQAGSVSVRIGVPMPDGRHISAPFAFSYNSNSAHHGVGWQGNASYFGTGGWSYILPTLTFSWGAAVGPSAAGVGSGPGARDQGTSQIGCDYYTGYMFQDWSGTTHSLGLTNMDVYATSGNMDCYYVNYWMQQSLTGGDAAVTASTTPLMANNDPPHPVTVSDNDGNVYYFSNSHLHSYPGDNTAMLGEGNAYTELPDWMEDRNGNRITFSDQGNGNVTITDSLGRTVLTTQGFGFSGNKVTVSGLNAYTLSWTGQSFNQTYSVYEIAPPWEPTNGAPYILCPGPTGGSSGSNSYFTTGTVTHTATGDPAQNGIPLDVVTRISLPNGQSYQFQYDPVTGLLSKVIYPDGAYSRYVWTINPMAGNDIASGNDGSSSNAASPCETIYDEPAIAQKFTSFDGTHEVLEQDYSYVQPTYVQAALAPYQKWTARQTTVTTKDLVAGTSYKTVYNYSPVELPTWANQETQQQKTAGVYPVNPAETSVLTYDGSGALLRVANKTYTDYWMLPVDEKDTLETGQTSETKRSYFSGSVPSDIWNYDYGNSSGSASSPAAVGALLKHIHADYATITPRLPGETIIDRAKDIITYDGSGNEVAESDFCYDGDITAFSGCATSSLQPVAAVQHDDTTFPAGTATGRGNVTTKIAKCFVGGTARPCSQGDSIVKYGWDQTGQMVSKTDANSNTTTYSYADNFDANPASQTNGYLTKITDAKNHTQSFQYAYADGQLIGTVGENGEATSYKYNEALRRLTETDFPDGGQTLLCYMEDMTCPGAPTTGHLSLFTQKKLDTTRYVNSTSIMDDMGHVIETQLNSDPSGVDKTDTTYDGLGRGYVVSNPYRSTAESTYANATTQYDALGRVIKVTRQDGSVVTTSYSGNSTTVTDEIGNQRRSVTDALGRLTEVDEPGDSYSATPATASITVTPATLRYVSGIGSYPATYSTGSVTISGTEQSKIVGAQNQTLWDAGNVCVTIHFTNNAPTYCGTYGQNSLASNVASSLASAINGSGNVTATASDTTVTLKMSSPGAVTLPLSMSVTSSQNFSPPSFSITGSASITGGKNAYAGTTSYDYGTATITVGTWTSTAVPYGQNGQNAGNNTDALVATALMGATNVTGSPVTARISSNTLNLTCNVVGPSCNGESVTITSTTQNTQYFTGGAFSGAATLLGGGANAKPSSLAIPFVTLYKYDALGNLTCVEQHGDASAGTGCSSYPNPAAADPYHTRMFSYNSLSELLGAFNPETGTITYTYDANGNVIAKTDARGITETYSRPTDLPIDALNRVQKVTFSNGDPAITFTFDQGVNGIGRRTGMTDASGLTSWAYDVMGRIASETRTINPGPGLNPVTNTVQYKYDLLGNITQLTYPNGTQISYGIDNAGRAFSATDITHGLNYVAGATFAPFGSLASFTQQISTTITNSFLYNPRLQICREMASSTGVTPSSCTDGTARGNVMDFQYDFQLGSNNGNLYTAQNNMDSSRTRTYTYDTLNRLISATTKGTTNSSGQTDCSIMVPGSTTKTKYWGELFTYDAWGNLISKNTSLCSAENTTLTADPDNHNRLVSAGYDAAGNMINYGGATYSYNGDSQMVSAGGYTYIYDGEGNRVAKTTGTSGTLYWYGAPGILLETDLFGNPQSEYLFFDGQRVARRDVSGVASSEYYYFANQIHSTALITDVNGTVEDDADYYPWGGALIFSSSLTNHYWFASKERDAETGLDYLGARYYSNSIGRFTQPDWSSKVTTIPYADLVNPQSLNLNSYVANNPSSRTDPLGHDWFNVNNTWQWQQGHVYHDKQGHATKAKGYSHLLVFTKTGTNRAGAAVGTLSLYDQDKVVAQSNAFSGGNTSDEGHKGATPNGTYWIHLDQRSEVNSPNQVNENTGQLHHGDGIQEIAPIITMHDVDGAGHHLSSTYLYDPRTEWGSVRANLATASGSTDMYIHGKEIDHDYTHGCICERSEQILHQLLNLDVPTVPVEVK